VSKTPGLLAAASDPTDHFVVTYFGTGCSQFGYASVSSDITGGAAPAGVEYLPGAHAGVRSLVFAYD